MAEEVVTVSFCYDGALDRLGTMDAIALGLFADERPLKGVTGFVDWRLHGMLSRLLLRELLTGVGDEHCLVPARGRLPMEKIFLFGLGTMGELNVNRFQQVVSGVISTMSRAQSTQYALSVWDLSRGRVAPEEAAGIFYRQLLADLERRGGEGVNRQITFVERGPWGKALRDGFKVLSDRGGELPIRLELR
jgi:hypothetical protein